MAVSAATRSCHLNLQHRLNIKYFLSSSAGTIPPIKSARGEGDDVKKLFSIGSPVILVTLGVALLFIIRKKRKEKRLKRLRGERKTKRVQREIHVTARNGLL